MRSLNDLQRKAEEQKKIVEDVARFLNEGKKITIIENGAAALGEDTLMFNHKFSSNAKKEA